MICGDTREEKIYETLQAIAHLENKEVKTVIGGKKYGLHYMGSHVNQISPDKKLAEDMKFIIKEYKIRLNKELEKLGAK